MKMYSWQSTTLNDYGSLTIIVMATSVKKAREKALLAASEMSKKVRKGIQFDVTHDEPVILEDDVTFISRNS
jgi:hypothetical protein